MTSKETDAMWRTRSEQPEAVRLARLLDRLADEGPNWPALESAAAELRHLHAVNTELLEALRSIANGTYDPWTNGATAQWIAENAITKATGEQA